MDIAEWHRHEVLNGGQLDHSVHVRMCMAMQSRLKLEALMNDSEVATLVRKAVFEYFERRNEDALKTLGL